MLSLARAVFSRWWSAFAATIVIALILTAVLVPLLFPIDLNELSDNSLLAPSASHPFGTDEFGRDVFHLVVAGTRDALTVGMATAISVGLVGVAVGAVSGFVGGRTDDFIMRVTEFFQVLPAFIVAAVFVVMLGSGTLGVIVVISLLGWPQIARVVRGEVLRLRELEFVDTMRCLGMRDISILGREIVPNAIPAAMTLGTLVVGRAILIATSLGFLGIGSSGPETWGGLLNRGQSFIGQAWWLSVFPGLAIVLTVVSFNLLGDAIGANVESSEAS